MVKGLVDQACVEAATEVELLHVCDLEADVEPFLSGELARNRDHVRRDVVALGADPVARREARHPARAAAELDHRGARTEVEQLEDVREVDQQARRLARRVAERLRPEPGAALLADRLRVLDLRSLPFGVRHLRGSVTQTNGSVTR